MSPRVPSTDPNSALAAVFFPCSTCGKELKIKPALVGKKVKCPRCVQIMLAPAPGKLPVIQDEQSAPVPTPIWRLLLPPFLLALILWSTFVLKLHNLDHTALTRWDEVFHAVVAQNVLKHPLKPTLVDAPYLPYDRKKWGENHVWLHKPILPFWQIALSFAVFGVNTFALRLPSALLGTGAAWLTYLIGKELFDRRTALLAAGLQAIIPFLVTLVQGYQFADHIDMALLFWIEAGMYFLMRSLRTGSWSDILLAGWAQGLAFLSKSYLAGIILGVALAAWLLPICRLSKRDDCKIGPLRILAMLGISLLTIAPWLSYCVTQYPDEFWQEESLVWQHLGANIEGWAAPWDRVAFDYLIAIYGVFYTPMLVAAIMLVGRAFARRHTGLWLMYAWGIGVVLPHLFAATKTPSATVIALPPLLLLLAYFISEAWRGERWPLTALVGVLIMSIAIPAVIRNPGYGYPNSRAFGTLMFQATWVLYHVAGSLAFVGVGAVAWFLVRRGCGTVSHDAVKAVGVLSRYLRTVSVLFCVAVLIWLASQTVIASWAVTSRDINEPFCVEVGEFAREHLPAIAVLFYEEHKGFEHLTTMFYADRTCYAMNARRLDEMAARVVAANGIPYAVTHRRMNLPVIYESRRHGPTIYRWQPPPHKE
jgi:4-amino-4-deoxy-L-arabinose transferase